MYYIERDWRDVLNVDYRKDDAPPPKTESAIVSAMTVERLVAGLESILQ